MHRARHREADPLVPVRPQGQRAQLPERGDDRRHPEVSAIKRETLICSVKCKFAVFLCFYIYLFFYSLIYLFVFSYKNITGNMSKISKMSISYLVRILFHR